MRHVGLNYGVTFGHKRLKRLNVYHTFALYVVDRHRLHCRKTDENRYWRGRHDASDGDDASIVSMLRRLWMVERTLHEWKNVGPFFQSELKFRHDGSEDSEKFLAQMFNGAVAPRRVREGEVCLTRSKLDSR